MMLQILFNHLFRHLSNWGAEISPRPKMSPPISLLQMRKFLKQPTCRIAFDPPHNLAGCHSGWCTHQNMHMIFANHPAHYPYLERLTHLTNHCSNSFSNIPCQNLVAVFCHPNKVVLNLKNRMAAIPVVHDTSQNVSFYQLKLTGWKPVVLTL